MKYFLIKKVITCKACKVPALSPAPRGSVPVPKYSEEEIDDFPSNLFKLLRRSYFAQN